jgi:hypothetical protein
MDQLRDSTAGHEPPADAPEDDERAKARKAQEVMARTSTDMRQVCLVILTLLAVSTPCSSRQRSSCPSCWRWC